MRYCRCDNNRIGVVRDGKVHDVTEIVNELPEVRYPHPWGDALVANLGSLRDKMEKLADASEGRPVSEEAQLIGQKVGIALLVGLMGLAFFNDLARLLG